MKPILFPQGIGCIISSINSHRPAHAEYTVYKIHGYQFKNGKHVGDAMLLECVYQYYGTHILPSLIAKVSFAGREFIERIQDNNMNNPYLIRFISPHIVLHLVSNIL